MTRFQIIEGLPDPELLSTITVLNQDLFALEETAEQLLSFFNQQKNLVFCLAYQQDELVGYKIGFQTIPGVFESWRGGVTPSAQRQGIAQQLIIDQHQWCEEHNFHTIQTVTNSINTPMLILNLKNGFTIVGMMVNRRNHLKLQLEKRRK